jgi:hypothetical protein
MDKMANLSMLTEAVALTNAVGQSSPSFIRSHVTQHIAKLLDSSQVSFRS